MKPNEKQEEKAKAPLFTPHGFCIAVLDNGFVYVGEITTSDGYVLISNARNIRRWGTTRGLGELIGGPTKDTQLDPCGEVIVPMARVCHYIKCIKAW